MGTHIRLMFEPDSGVSINDELAQWIFSGYLNGGPGGGQGAEWAGYIAFDANRRKRSQKLEPLYQMMIFDPEENHLQDRLLPFLENNPLPGYYVHVNEKTIENEVAIR